MKTLIAIIVALALLASVSIPSYVHYAHAQESNTNIAHGGDGVAINPEEYVVTTTISISGKYMVIGENVDYSGNYVIITNVRYPEESQIMILPVFHVTSIKQR